MKKTWYLLLSILLLAGTLLCLVGCFGDEEPEGDRFTIRIDGEVLAGQRAEILITKNGDFSLHHEDYEWMVVGEDLVGVEFQFDDMDHSDNYTNKFFFARRPGTVKIQAKNTTNGEMLSNVLTVVVTSKQISTVEDLKALANSDQTVVLAADLDLSGEGDWTPIEGFKGGLIGGGHTITGLKINSINGENIGLFGTLEGIVEDLIIKDAVITSRGDAGKAGIVAGTNKGQIENVTVSGSVTAAYYDHVGGIAGYCDGGAILSCENQAAVQGKNAVGGIAGTASVGENDRLSKNLNKGTVKGKNGVGGVFGELTGPKLNNSNQSVVLSLTENRNQGVIEGESAVGGIVGKSASQELVSFSVFENSGTVTAQKDYVGGIVGYAERLAEITVSKNLANITGANYVGGFAGKAQNCAIRIAENSQTIIGRGYVGGIAGYAGRIESATNTGEIYSCGPILEDGENKSYVGGIAGYCTALVDSKNTSEITAEHSYVGGLAGYVIVSGDDEFCGNENRGVVAGGADCVGGIAGFLTIAARNTGDHFTVSFLGNKNHGDISGETLVGGIVGLLEKSNTWSGRNGRGMFEVSDCWNYGDIEAEGDYAGGLFGHAWSLSVLTVCENDGDVTGRNYVGGFAGLANEATIKIAENRNRIEGYAYVGGIVGQGGKLENCTNNGTVVSLGVTVVEGQDYAYVGGIAGYCTGINECVNNSDLEVTTGGSYVGGVAGLVYCYGSNLMNDNRNNGDINGGSSQYVGGVAGCLRSASWQTYDDFTYQVGNNQNTGDIAGNERVGGICGAVEGASDYPGGWDGFGYFEMVYCQNEGMITGNTYVGGIAGSYIRLETAENVMATNTTTTGEKLGM